MSNDGICRLMISNLGIFITKLQTTVMLEQENQGKHETADFLWELGRLRKSEGALKSISVFSEIVGAYQSV